MPKGLIHSPETINGSRLPSDGLSSVSFDTHFQNLKRPPVVDFNPEMCAGFFAEVGIAARNIPRIHVFVRPDYKLGYTKEERAELARLDPDYDTESASTVWQPNNTLLITLVYDTAYGVNSLLRHEAEHARRMFAAEVKPVKEALMLGTAALAGVQIGEWADMPSPFMLGVTAFALWAAYRLRRHQLLYSMLHSDEGSRLYNIEDAAADQVQNNKRFKKLYGKIITIKTPKQR